MKTISTKFLYLFLLGLFLSGCSSKTSNSKTSPDGTAPKENIGTLSVTYLDGDEKQVSENIDVIFGTWSKDNDKNFVTHNICLSNSYMSGSHINKVNRSKPEIPKYVVCIIINDDIGTTRDSLITQGDYLAGGGPVLRSTNKPKTIKNIGITKYGKSEKSVGPSAERLEGVVKIITSSKELIKGEINAFDDKSTIKGDFQIYLTRN